MEQTTEQILEHLLAGQEQMMAKMKAKMGTKPKTNDGKAERKDDGQVGCLDRRDRGLCRKIEGQSRNVGPIKKHHKVPKEEAAGETAGALED
jgi:hypothetical protein